MSNARFDPDAAQADCERVKTLLCATQAMQEAVLTLHSAASAPPADSPGEARGFDLAPDPQPAQPHALAAVIADFARSVDSYRRTPMVALIHAACAILLYHTVKRLADSAQPGLDTLKQQADTLSVVARILEAYPVPVQPSDLVKPYVLPPYFKEMVRQLYGVNLSADTDVNTDINGNIPTDVNIDNQEALKNVSDSQEREEE